MDFTSKCARSGLALATVPVQLLALGPMKLVAWIAPDAMAKFMESRMPDNLKKSGMKADDSFLKFMLSFDLAFHIASTKLRDIWKNTGEGKLALDSKLYNLDTGEWVSLLSFAKPNRPLVLNFGSCS
jgi:hypothetical protein